MKIALGCCLFLLFTQPFNAQIYRLDEMNTRQIAALDRARTVILMPGGTMEEHGPYLPAFSDGYMNIWWAEHLAQELARMPGWRIVIYPTIPLGDGGANEIGGKFTWPGTYGVRLKTLRAVYMDLGTELGEQGFKWVFVLQNHGSPMHNMVLDQAGDFFHDTYGGEMINLFGLEPPEFPKGPEFPAEFAKEVGIDIHAGASETSRLVFIKPLLVDPGYVTAKPFTVSAPQDLTKVAEGSDWLGYFSSPRLATASFGAERMNHGLSFATTTVKKILAGEDPRKIPRYATRMMAEEAGVAGGSFAYDDKVEKKQTDWIKKKGLTW